MSNYTLHMLMNVCSCNKDHCGQSPIGSMHATISLNQRVHDDASQLYIIYKIHQVERSLEEE